MWGPEIERIKMSAGVNFEWSRSVLQSRLSAIHTCPRNRSRVRSDVIFLDRNGDGLPEVERITMSVDRNF